MLELTKKMLREVLIPCEGRDVKYNVYIGLFIYCLFNDAVSSSDYVASNGRTILNTELEGTWKEAVLNSYFEFLPRHLPGGTEENQEKPQ
jgi:hypothetical protein